MADRHDAITRLLAAPGGLGALFADGAARLPGCGPGRSRRSRRPRSRSASGSRAAQAEECSASIAGSGAGGVDLGAVAGVRRPRRAPTRHLPPRERSGRRRSAGGPTGGCAALVETPEDEGEARLERLLVSDDREIVGQILAVRRACVRLLLQHAADGKTTGGSIAICASRSGTPEETRKAILRRIRSRSPVGVLPACSRAPSRRISSVRRKLREFSRNHAFDRRSPSPGRWTT